jgi:glucose/arabinose dehydrogenase
VDKRVEPQRPDLVAKAIKPDYALGNHVAPLGLAMNERGAYVGQHGSWNRRPPSGYNVVFIPFRDGKPSGKPVEVLSDFLGPQGEAYGRPVGVAIDKRGALLVADDVGNVVWRISELR